MFCNEESGNLYKSNCDSFNNNYYYCLVEKEKNIPVLRQPTTGKLQHWLHLLRRKGASSATEMAMI